MTRRVRIPDSRHVHYPGAYCYHHTWKAAVRCALRRVANTEKRMRIRKTRNSLRWYVKPTR